MDSNTHVKCPGCHEDAYVGHLTPDPEPDGVVVLRCRCGLAIATTNRKREFYLPVRKNFKEVSRH